MRKTLVSLGLAVLVLLPAEKVSARDFPEPLPAFDALHGIDASSPVLLPTSYLRLRYDNFLFRGSDTDTFQIGILGSFGLFRIGEIFALKLTYGSHLLVGPLSPGDEAASVAEWWMNSIQYQYGFFGAWNLRGLHVLVEYSRMSNHPLRGNLTEKDQFENPAFERIAWGLVLPPSFPGPFRVETYLRGGFVDLFDYWQAKNIPKPRTRWFLRFGGEAELSLTSRLRGFFHPTADLLFTRDGKTDYTFHARTGLSFASGSGTFSLYFLYTRVGDTEEIVGKKHPIHLMGIGFTISS